MPWLEVIQLVYEWYQTKQMLLYCTTVPVFEANLSMFLCSLVVQTVARRDHNKLDFDNLSSCTPFPPQETYLMKHMSKHTVVEHLVTNHSPQRSDSPGIPIRISLIWALVLSHLSSCTGVPVLTHLSSSSPAPEFWLSLSGWPLTPDSTLLVHNMEGPLLRVHLLIIQVFTSLLLLLVFLFLLLIFSLYFVCLLLSFCVLATGCLNMF